VSNRDGTRFWGRTQRIRFPVFLETFNTIDWVEPSDTLLANDRYLRRAADWSRREAGIAMKVGGVARSVQTVLYWSELPRASAR
jgi:predicted metal-dependent hydrolase